MSQKVIIAIHDKPNNRYQPITAEIIGESEYQIATFVHPSLPYKQGDKVRCVGRTRGGLPIVERKLTDYEISLMD